MELMQRYIVVAQITITEVKEKDDGGRPKPMTTSVTMALVDTRPETIMEAVKSFVDDHWSKKPHRITKVHSIKAQSDYIWAEA